MNELYIELSEYLDKSTALTTALTLIEWDTETLAPEQAGEQTAKMVGILSREYFQSITCKEVLELLTKLEKPEQWNTLEKEQQAVIHQLRKTYDELKSIPEKEYQAYCELTAKSVNIWAKAREEDKFEIFAPVLEEIISYKKKFAAYRQKPGEKLYDVLLNDFEEGFLMEQLDQFFGMIREELVPFIKSIQKEQDSIHKEYNEQFFEVEKQREFCKWLASYVGFDETKGVICESAHPFTTNLHNKDVRITNHFYEHNLESAIFSVIHESGHAIYEMNIADSITQTIIGTGASMAMHESQSRFFENVIGKNRSFWKPIYNKLQSTFKEQLERVSLDQFMAGVKKAQCSLIRTEADELTYPLHILVRYEVEKAIMEGTVTVSELPKLWEDKYEAYLGIRPESAACGILQDVHWACGDFGYFPSYAIGSAIAAQIYNYMKEHYPFETWLEEGNIKSIIEVLQVNIHQFGMSKNTNQILKDMTGETFEPKYYIQYLKDKYIKE